MRWLAFDFGPQLGDNFRGLLFLKTLKAHHPEVELDCWITPELHRQLAPLLQGLDFISHWVQSPRPPQTSYQINHHILAGVLAAGREFTLDNLPPGQGPDNRTYDKIIPTAEPWFTAKLLTGQALEDPDPMNQGEFLCQLLQITPEQAAANLPVFGHAEPRQEHICLGMCRPDPADPKQPTRNMVAQAWEAALSRGQTIYALDYQDWLDPPDSPLVHDWRLKPLNEKITILNTAQRFIGTDGGLTHFAAACGCPTTAFYGSKNPEHGLLVGPYPRLSHTFHHRFAEFLEEVRG